MVRAPFSLYTTAVVRVKATWERWRRYREPNTRVLGCPRHQLPPSHKPGAGSRSSRSQFSGSSGSMPSTARSKPGKRFASSSSTRMDPPLPAPAYCIRSASLGGSHAGRSAACGSSAAPAPAATHRARIDHRPTRLPTLEARNTRDGSSWYNRCLGVSRREAHHSRTAVGARGSKGSMYPAHTSAVSSASETRGPGTRTQGALVTTAEQMLSARTTRSGTHSALSTAAIAKPAGPAPSRASLLPAARRHSIIMPIAATTSRAQSAAVRTAGQGRATRGVCWPGGPRVPHIARTASPIATRAATHAEFRR
mmetsp:Transcript_19997/g.50423  ORF Transcript_19997/g.50423 Transcript_19997/m.50423 type:complete len:309 (-) Transcript_19997:39-965(-)